MDEQSLAVSLCGRTLPSPLILASGVAGENMEWLVDAARAGAGAVVTKSASVEPREGHPEPTVIEWEHGLINAVGLRNSGAAAVAGQIAELKRRLAPLGVPLIASIVADTVSGFGEVAAILAGAAPDMIEVNISCPNVEAEFGRPFAADAASAAAVTRVVKDAVACPVIVKLSPNVTDIAIIARSVEDAGADAICAINSLTGMVIDMATGKPVAGQPHGRRHRRRHSPAGRALRLRDHPCRQDTGDWPGRRRARARRRRDGHGGGDGRGRWFGRLCARPGGVLGAAVAAC